jgi:hypothetical protein
MVQQGITIIAKARLKNFRKLAIAIYDQIVTKKFKPTFSLAATS